MSTTSPPNEQYSFVRTWGSPGTVDGQFKYPNSIAIDSSGNVYVADGEPNHRMQEFAPSR